MEIPRLAGQCLRLGLLRRQSYNLRYQNIKFLFCPIKWVQLFMLLLNYKVSLSLIFNRNILSGLTHLYLFNCSIEFRNCKEKYIAYLNKFGPLEYLKKYTSDKQSENIFF